MDAVECNPLTDHVLLAKTCLLLVAQLLPVKLNAEPDAWYGHDQACDTRASILLGLDHYIGENVSEMPNLHNCCAQISTL